MSVGVWVDATMLDHDPAHTARVPHPEAPQRLRALLELVDEAALAAVLDLRAPTPASREALVRIHHGAHVDAILDAAGQALVLDPDTSLSPGSVGAATLAAGALVDAVDSILAGEHRRGMCLVRPPGHHAEPGRAMGFCVFDNVAVGAAAALTHAEIERVAILDWDVHHGNGTQAAFWTDERVLCVDLHQHPLFPGTGAMSEAGAGAGQGATVNLPLPPGLGDAEYLAIFDAVAGPRIDAFAPDLILVSAGFDAHRDDPLGAMELSAAGFASLCARVRDLADRHAEGRLLLTLEGGYDLGALRDSVRACLEILAGGEAPKTGPRGAGPATRRLIDALAAGLGAPE